MMVPALSRPVGRYGGQQPGPLVNWATRICGACTWQWGVLWTLEAFRATGLRSFKLFRWRQSAIRPGADAMRRF